MKSRSVWSAGACSRFRPLKTLEKSASKQGALQTLRELIDQGVFLTRRDGQSVKSLAALTIFPVLRFVIFPHDIHHQKESPSSRCHKTQHGQSGVAEDFERGLHSH